MTETIVIKESPAEVIKIHEDVRKVYPKLENLTVRSRAEQQIFEHKNSYGYDVITVEPINIKLQKKEVTPSYTVQEITADSEYDGLEKVTVKAKTGYETDDADVSAEEILFGKIAYNKDGRVVGTMTLSNNALISVTSNLSSYSSAAQIVKCLEKIELDISESSCLTNLFYDCNNLKSVKLIATDTYRPMLMSSVFSRCMKLQDISASINTENVTNFSGCFFMCCELSAIPELKTENCSDFARMFNRVSKTRENTRT